MQRDKIGIIILAAGASTRLGRPKQLLKFQNNSLISNSVKSAINSKSKKTLVVLGSNSELIKKEIEDFPIEILENKNWKEGMSSSIKCGLNYFIKEKAETNAVVIMLCDQPLIDNNHLNFLIDKFSETEKPIVATQYENSVGVPALFSNNFFDELLTIKGDKGAKQLIQNNLNKTEIIKVPEAELDIDTIEDYEKLKKLK